MGILASAIGVLLTAIYSVINNYGITIIVLTILVRAILIPLYAKQQKYTQAMAELQPRINEIQTKYAADRETMNAKLNEVYAEVGASPLTGCLPMVIQLPIIMGLYTLLRNPLAYIAEAHVDKMIVAVHESFLWIPDLSQSDPWILPILAGITTYLSFSSQQADAGANASMKAMKYFFPVMIFMLGRSFPASLALYWTVGNLVTMVQQKILNNMSARKKLKNEVKEEVKKSRKEARG
jgi:YidC/Oxa1 family membrane protein insertase